MKPTVTSRQTFVGKKEDFLPEDVGTKVTIIGDLIVFVTIAHDEFAGSPLDDDGMGEIISFNRRHTSSAKASYGREELETNPDAVALSYFEHGLCSWTVSGDRPLGTEGDWQWDGVDLAGVWLPDKETLVTCSLPPGPERKAWMAKQASVACEVYTQYCNGEIYGYDIEVYRYREPYDRLADYRFDKPLEEDSCWGFYGDDVKEAVMESLPDELQYGQLPN